MDRTTRSFPQSYPQPILNGGKSAENEKSSGFHVVPEVARPAIERDRQDVLLKNKSTKALYTERAAETFRCSLCFSIP